MKQGMRMATTQILQRCERGEVSSPIALMELLIATEDADVVGGLLAPRAGQSAGASALAKLFRDHEAGCRRVAAMLRADVDRPPAPGASIEEGVAYSRRLFDWSVEQSESASVALYSLGSPELLAAATAEIVTLLRQWGLLDGRRAFLDLGCGTGRLEEALAGEVGRIHGIDVSTAMVAAAQRRCAGITGVTIAPSTGMDLAPVGSGSYDVVLAVDSFPYVVQAGERLVERMFSEAARVLVPAGEMVILNYSYRGDRERDRRESRQWAERHGFEALVTGTLPFQLWNGDAYRFRKN